MLHKTPSFLFQKAYSILNFLHCWPFEWDEKRQVLVHRDRYIGIGKWKLSKIPSWKVLSYCAIFGHSCTWFNFIISLILYKEISASEIILFLGVSLITILATATELSNIIHFDTLIQYQHAQYSLDKWLKTKLSIPETDDPKLTLIVKGLLLSGIFPIAISFPTVYLFTFAKFTSLSHLNWYFELHWTNRVSWTLLTTWYICYDTAMLIVWFVGGILGVQFTNGWMKYHVERLQKLEINDLPQIEKINQKEMYRMIYRMHTLVFQLETVFLEYFFPISLSLACLLLIFCPFLVIKMLDNVQPTLILLIGAAGILVLIFVWILLRSAAEIKEASEQLPALIQTIAAYPRKLDQMYTKSCRRIVYNIGGFFDIQKDSFAMLMSDIVMSTLIDLLLAF